MSKGLSQTQSAGIVGNLIQESGSPINPSAVHPGGAGRGIAQWGTGCRGNTDARTNMRWYAGLSGRSVYSLSAQLDFTWCELATFSGYGLSSLKAQPTVSGATIAFMQKFEGCGNCVTSQRIAYANGALRDYGTGGGGVTETSLPVLRVGSSGSAVRSLARSNTC